MSSTDHTMSTPKQSKSRCRVDMYLFQPKGPGSMFYARVSVPPTLIPQVGKTHLIRALRTTERGEANLLKFAAVGEMKRQLADLRRASRASGAREQQAPHPST